MNDPAVLGLAGGAAATPDAGAARAGAVASSEAAAAEGSSMTPSPAATATSTAAAGVPSKGAPSTGAVAHQLRAAGAEAAQSSSAAAAAREAAKAAAKAADEAAAEEAAKAAAEAAAEVAAAAQAAQAAEVAAKAAEVAAAAEAAAKAAEAAKAAKAAEAAKVAEAVESAKAAEAAEAAKTAALASRAETVATEVVAPAAPVDAGGSSVAAAAAASEVVTGGEEEEEEDDEDEEEEGEEDAYEMLDMDGLPMDGIDGIRELHALQSQIDRAMRIAMYEMIASTVQKESLSEADADWLAALLSELRDRLNALTPHRADFHAELEAALDVPLARQMLLHGAADQDDANGLVEVVYRRLRMLCAPVQDADVDDLRTTALGEPTPGRTLASLLCKADGILSVTEELNRRAREDLLRLEAQRPGSMEHVLIN